MVWLVRTMYRVNSRVSLLTLKRVVIASLPLDINTPVANRTRLSTSVSGQICFSGAFPPQRG